jgi:hypothetical protein
VYILNPKFIDEDRKIEVDFTNDLTAGTTISTASVTATVYSGVDSSPQSIVSGASTISGPRVTQKIIDGVAGCTYLLTYNTTTSDSQVLQKKAFLTILPASGI